ncbi:MAG: hypothetical protein RLZZ337_1689 [Bacteroidota bacterium]|jgi:hypothetical protein
MNESQAIRKSKPKAKGYKRFYPALKWLVSLLSLGFFAFQLTQMNGDLVADISKVIGRNGWWFVLVASLAFINWNAEAFKLRTLLETVIALKPIRAFFIVLGGMAISNFTPARTGEYVGRGLLLKKVHPLKVVIATITGNLAQVVFTYSIGFLALFYFVLFTGKGNEWIDNQAKLYSAIAVFLGVVLFLVFAKSILLWAMNYVPPKMAKTLKFIRKYNGQLFAKVLAFAGTRYVAFSLQFFLLLYIFSDFQLPVSALALVPVAYLLQTLVPVPAISDIGVRVAVSQLLFGEYIATDAILQAVSCLWFINLILPGLLGTFYLLYSLLKK